MTVDLWRHCVSNVSTYVSYLPYPFYHTYHANLSNLYYHTLLYFICHTHGKIPRFCGTVKYTRANYFGIPYFVRAIFCGMRVFFHTKIPYNFVAALQLVNKKYFAKIKILIDRGIELWYIVPVH